jgi:pilus assembly protein Flp/PilA
MNLIRLNSPHSVFFFFNFQTYNHGVTRIRSTRNGTNNTAISHSGEPKMSKTILQFVRDDSGATAIEYGLIAAGIAVAIIAVVQGVGTKLTATFQSVSDNLK